MNQKLLIKSMEVARDHLRVLKELEKNNLDLYEFTEPVVGQLETIILNEIFPKEDYTDNDVEVLNEWFSSDRSESANDFLRLANFSTSPKISEDPNSVEKDLRSEIKRLNAKIRADKRDFQIILYLVVMLWVIALTIWNKFFM